MLSEECTSIEENIKRHQQVLGELQTDIRLAERRVKGLTTMVANLEAQKAEKESLLYGSRARLKGEQGQCGRTGCPDKNAGERAAGHFQTTGR